MLALNDPNIEMLMDSTFEIATTRKPAAYTALCILFPGWISLPTLRSMYAASAFMLFDLR